jgi:hypothetical protein
MEEVEVVTDRPFLHMFLQVVHRFSEEALHY